METFKSIFSSEFAPASSEIVIGISILGLLMFGSFKGDTSTRLVGYLCMVVMIMASFIVISFSGKVFTAFHGFYEHNLFTAFCKIITLLTGATILGITLRVLEREEMNRFEYPLLILLSTLGMLGMISSNELITMYIFLELQSLPLYILVALKRDRLIASEAAIKYFVLGAFASALILYGSSFLYGVTGTTEFTGLFSAFKDSELSQLLAFKVGAVLLLSGIAFKLALAPFHMWSPDIYEGSSTLVTVFIATAPKWAAFALLMRLSSQMTGDLERIWIQALIGLAIVSMIIGALGALFQSNIKRLIGYSAISHMGYASLGLLGRTMEGYGNVLVYMMIYLVTTVGIFSMLINLRKNNKPVEALSDFSGIARTSPLEAVIMTIFLFSLAGIPPLGGFFAKLGVFSTALKADYYKSVILGVITSVISTAYYLKVIKIIYFEDSSSAPIKILGEKYHFRGAFGIMIVTTIFILFYTIYPSILEKMAYQASHSLFERFP